MFFLFRKEVFVTFSQQASITARDALAAQKIPYFVKTHSRSAATAGVDGRARAATGLPRSMDQNCAYHIYVQRRHYERAKAVLQGTYGR